MLFVKNELYRMSKKGSVEEQPQNYADIEEQNNESIV